MQENLRFCFKEDADVGISPEIKISVGNALLEFISDVRKLLWNGEKVLFVMRTIAKFKDLKI